MSYSPRVRIALACASGLLFAGAFAPNNARLLAWIGLSFFLLTLLEVSRKFAALLAMVFSAGFYFATIPWVYAVMREHGGLGPAASFGMLALLVFYLGLYNVVFAVVVSALSKHSVVLASVAAPCVWVAVELARVWFPDLTFPWNLAGYAVWYHAGIMQLAAYTGIYGVSFLVVGVNAAFACGTYRRNWVACGVCAAFLLAAVISEAPSQRALPAAPARYVATVIQPNLPQLDRLPADWMELPQIRLSELEQMSLAATKERPGSLLIWPEVPLPLYFGDARIAERMTRLARESGTNFLLGVVDFRAPENANPAVPQRGNAYNSAVMLSPAGQRVFQYDKIQLVPFGEFVPFRRLFFFAESLVREVGGYSHGSRYAIGELPDVPGPAEMRTPGPPRKFGVFICFEAVFPNRVRKFTAGGAELLINISNDGWYGRSSAPEQHLAMATARAIENRRWLLRATNNGHTVAIDPYGRIVAQVPVDRRAVFQAPYDFRSDLTVYARWGDWFAWLCVMATIAVIVAGARIPSLAGRRQGSETGK